MPSQPAIFFDRDNTLIVNDGFLSNVEHVHLVEGAAGLIAGARKMGYAIVVVSNQSGVARGLFTEESVRAVNRRMDELLRRENPEAIIDRHEYCPFHPEGVVPRYRMRSELCKPSPGMLLRAAGEMNLDLARSWLIGDAPRDIEAGKNAGCRTILFRPRDMRISPAAVKESDVVPDAIVETLDEALAIIRI